MNKRQSLADIKRTIKKLDAKIPKWRYLIDKETLDIGSTINCVTSQIFGSYEKGLMELDIDPYFADCFGLQLDIDSDDCRYQTEYDKLTKLWREAI